jgi:hypothetical protein
MTGAMLYGPCCRRAMLSKSHAQGFGGLLRLSFKMLTTLRALLCANKATHSPSTTTATDGTKFSTVPLPRGPVVNHESGERTRSHALPHLEPDSWTVRVTPNNTAPTPYDTRCEGGGRRHPSTCPPPLRALAHRVNRVLTAMAPHNDDERHSTRPWVPMTNIRQR